MIPRQLGNLSTLQYLNLRDSDGPGLYAENLQWLNGLSLLEHLDLSNVNLSGEFDWLQVTNMLPSGELSLSLQNCTQLITVELGENEFDGSIPIRMGKRLSNLMILILRSNKFHGHIPSELCALNSLQILDLAHNNLEGTIPRCFNNFSAMVTKRISSSHILYTIGSNGGVLEKASLVTKRNVYEYRNNLGLITIMDLSNNSLSGEIPIEVTSLLELHTLNLSNNVLRGRIPEQIGAMRALESVDFSVNQLSGEIPSSLTFLSHLNLSCNNLTGKVPSSTQLQSFNASSFMGNELCGPPLSEKCIENGGLDNFGNGGSKEGDGFEVQWSWLSMGLGFAVGFWGVFGPVLLNSSWTRCGTNYLVL